LQSASLVLLEPGRVVGSQRSPSFLFRVRPARWRAVTRLALNASKFQSQDAPVEVALLAVQRAARGHVGRFQGCDPSLPTCSTKRASTLSLRD
jgi:hypothetical protein